MTHRERILEIVASACPDRVTVSQLVEALAPVSRATVYRQVRALMTDGLVHGSKVARRWALAGVSSPPIEGPTLADRFSWRVNRSARSVQARWLVPLLSLPEGRAWFLEQLRCPCVAEEAAAAEVYHFCYPLRDLLAADLAGCGGDRALEDGCIAYYDALLGLAGGAGVDTVWRRGQGALRSPAARGGAGWSDALLARRLQSRRLRIRAARARDAMHSMTHALLVTSGHMVLVHCAANGAISPRRHRRQRDLGVLLERRLNRTCCLGAVVHRTADLGSLNLPYVRWDDIERWLAARRD